VRSISLTEAPITRANSKIDTPGGEVEYVDELVIDEDEPCYETEAPETGDGDLRRVYVFKFHPVIGSPPPARSKLDGVG
jgi:hypothetical protein